MGDPFGEMEDDPDELGVEPEKRNPVPERTAPTKKAPGPVLILDAPDEDDEIERPALDGRKPNGVAAGPKLLGATDEETTTPAKTGSVKADPFEEEDDIPARAATSKKPAKIADEDDDELLRDLDAPPAQLPRAALESKPKPVARDPFKDEEERDELPALLDDEEQRSILKRKPIAPAVPKGIEDADDPLPEPARTVKPLLPESEGDATPRDLETPPPRRSIPPALPQLDEPIPEEPAPPPKPELPKLTIDKVAPPTAVLGKPMVYQIVVRNTGDIPAYQVVVEDAIPEGLEIDGSIPQGSSRTPPGLETGDNPRGAQKKISVRVIPQNAGAIGSVATLNFSPVPPPPANPAAPQLTFKVDAPRQAAVGTPIEFNFRVKNVGAVPATGVTIRDVLPAGLRHADGDDLEYEIGKIAPGKTSEVKLVLTAAQAGPTVNRVVVTADGNVSEATEVPIDVVAPALTVSRGGPKQVYPGKIGRFTNTVANSGAGQVAKINLVEIVPAGMEFVEASDGGSYNAAKRTVTWAIDRLTAGESKTVKVSLRSAAGPADQRRAGVRQRGTSAEAIGTTLVAGVPALKIELGELPPLVEVGEIVKISVRIINRGTDVATGVRTSIPVPPGLKFLAAAGPTGLQKYETVQVAGDQGAPASTEIQFAPIDRIDTKGEVAFELTFKGRAGRDPLRGSRPVRPDDGPDPQPRRLHRRPAGIGRARIDPRRSRPQTEERRTDRNITDRKILSTRAGSIAERSSKSSCPKFSCLSFPCFQCNSWFHRPQCEPGGRTCARCPSEPFERFGLFHCAAGVEPHGSGRQERRSGSSLRGQTIVERAMAGKLQNRLKSIHEAGPVFRCSPERRPGSLCQPGRR